MEKKAKMEIAGFLSCVFMGGLFGLVSQIMTSREDRRQKAKMSNDGFLTSINDWNEIAKEENKKKIPSYMVVRYEMAAETAMKTGKKKDLKSMLKAMIDISEFQQSQLNAFEKSQLHLSTDYMDYIKAKAFINS